MKHTRVWADAARYVRKEHGDLPDECRRYFVIRCIIDTQVQDVVTTASKKIRASGVKTADDVRLQEKPLVRYSTKRRDSNLQLRKYLYKNLYFNPEVHGPNQRAVRMLEELFDYYSKHRSQIGEHSRKRARKIGWPRAICDYLSGMTDRYAIRDHERLFDPK